MGMKWQAKKMYKYLLRCPELLLKKQESYTQVFERIKLLQLHQIKDDCITLSCVLKKRSKMRIEMHETKLSKASKITLPTDILHNVLSSKIHEVLKLFKKITH